MEIKPEGALLGAMMRQTNSVTGAIRGASIFISLSQSPGVLFFRLPELESGWWLPPES